MLLRWLWLLLLTIIMLHTILIIKEGRKEGIFYSEISLAGSI
jgi:hypothetical protein